MSRLIEKVKVKLINGALSVDVPTFMIVDELMDDPFDDPKHKDRDGNPNKIAKPLKEGEKVDILVPNDEAEEIGNSGKYQLVKDKIKKKYRGQSKWDNDNPLDIE